MNGVYIGSVARSAVIDECLVVEFRVRDDDCPLADATRAAGIEIDAQPPQLRADGYALLSFTAPESSSFADALDDDDRIRYLHFSRSDGRQNGRCLSKQPCVVHDLVSAGLIVESLRYRDGSATVTGAVVGHEVLRGVLNTAGETVGVALERAYPLQTDDKEAIAKRWNVTPRQEEALEAAVAHGYFTVPRGATAAEVAADLDISKSAFIERLHRGQHALFSQLFA
jgi:predicted DNA binding protein